MPACQGTGRPRVELMLDTRKVRAPRNNGAG